MCREIVLILVGMLVGRIDKGRVCREAIVGEVGGIVFVVGVVLVLHYWADGVVVDIWRTIEFMLLGWLLASVVKGMARRVLLG